MDYYSSQISKLIEELSKLPGIGNKTAQRLAFHIINMPEEQVERLSSSIRDAKHNVHYCKECFTLTDQELCPICRSQTRDHSVIMVVENPRDLAAYEKTGKFENLQMFPGMGSDLSKRVSFRTDYKYAIWEDYVIIYKVDNEYVEIYRVINRYQDITRIFD